VVEQMRLGPVSERLAEFVVSGAGLSGPDIQARIGLPADRLHTAGAEYIARGRRRRRVDTAWVICSVAPSGQEPRVDATEEVEQHLDWLFEVLKPVRAELRALRDDGAEFLLRVVQYMASTEFQGHGIPINAAWISMLSELGGRVDIDQYVRSRPEPT
jgi:hypothetical protein